ncbi:NTF2-related export protein-like [Temnothorax longispinosus]|uniref:NTF2-related export protein-like n=1 Tax=Temnothorax longispinosus TaxID=300112 RepID=UPI003A994F30
MVLCIFNAYDFDNKHLQNLLDPTIAKVRDFTQLYYEFLDNNRDMVLSMYVDHSFVIWNEHTIAGKEEIKNLWQKLPTSRHMMDSFEAYAIAADQTIFMVKINGFVEYEGYRRLKIRNNLMITAVDNSLKVVNDSIRVTLDNITTSL